MKKLDIAIKKPVFALIALIHFVFMAKAQQSDIAARFSKYQESTFQEKLFVHTDKPSYLAGEIVWIKIYIVNALSHQPSNISKVAYVDVIDNAQTTVLQAKIALKDGSGSGSIYIPVNTGTNNYHFRAYTSWMKNFSADYFFNKILTIVNPLKSPPPSANNGTPVVDVQFFPEGGNLVRGITSRVGFKIIGADGKSANLSGIIINQRNDTVAKFKPLKFGMGNFMFTPAANTNYRAIVILDNGKTVFKELPAIRDQGYVMRATDIDANKIEVLVKSNLAATGSVFLFAHTRQSAKIAESADLAYGEARFVIDKTKLGEGISHITLFNSAKQPVCERLIFKQPSQKLLLNAAPDQDHYDSRKKVTINLTAKTSDQAVATDLSMAIYKIDSLQKGDENSIMSYIWLSSDLRGRIDSADYYFAHINKQTNEALNNLLLTQGWRRFEWSDVLNEKPAPLKFLPEMDGHIITGKVINTVSGTAAPGIIVHMGVPGKRLQYYNSKSDSTGRLLFNTTDYYGNNEVILQTNRLVDSTYTLSINNPFSESFADYKLPEYNFNKAMLWSVQQGSIGMQAQNIYNGQKQNQYYDPQIDIAAFYKPKYTFLLDNYTRFVTLEEVFREYITAANVAKRQNKFHLRIFNGERTLDGDPLAFIDGVPVLEIDKLFAIDPLKVKTIDVMPEKYYYGAVALNGIVTLTTYKGDLGGFEIDPHAVIVDYEGLQLQRIFYSPAYETAQQINSTIPDFRNVLYWQPNAGTNTSGKNTLSFYTSDVNGEYLGVVQGTTQNGDVGGTTFSFKVKNGVL